MEKNFIEEEFFNHYKKIRNQIRKYNSKELFNFCIKYLYLKTDDPFYELKKQPWLILLLIKWIFTKNNYQRGGKQKFDHGDFNKIIQALKDLGGHVRMPNQYEHWGLFFRNLAYQQTIYQIPMSPMRFCRQKILFGNLNQNNYIRSSFYKETGLELETVIDLSLILFTYYISKDEKSPQINKKWFNSIKLLYNDAQIQKFLSSLSIEYYKISKFIKQMQKNNINSEDFYEQTPFLKYPLIKLNENYICLYPKILYRSIEDLVYNRLRSIETNKFMNKFGKIFENYIAKGLKYAKLKFVDEYILKKELIGEGKVVDFLINENGSNVLIDAKAVELSYKGGVTHEKKIVEDRVKTSIIKAINQTYDVVLRLHETKSKNEIIKSRDINYLIIITFKELYLGTAKFFYEVIAQNRIDKIIGKYHKEMIPLENIYFITIDDFDLLIEYIYKLNKTLTETIEKAKKSDNKIDTMKFEFSQHLNEWKVFDYPKYIKKEYESLISKFYNILN